jgi:imidazolonepropionase-like amidohydrolase
LVAVLPPSSVRVKATSAPWAMAYILGSAREAEEISKYPPRSMMLSYRAGVMVAAGTDAGTPFNRHCMNARELELMVAAGLKPMEALVSAMKTAAGACGLQDITGTIEQGKQVDIIVVDVDPLKDIKILQDSSRIRLIMKGGAVEVDRGLLS